MDFAEFKSGISELTESIPSKFEPTQPSADPWIWDLLNETLKDVYLKS